MFDFVRKRQLWDELNLGNLELVQGKQPFHLKTIQDLVVYGLIKDLQDAVIGEIGGGDSRLLPILAPSNTCYNIEKFEGAAAGPNRDVELPGVEIKRVFMGEFAPELENNSIDVLFSVSVIEHVLCESVTDFFLDCERVLKPGGLMVHAIDMYLEDEPSDYWSGRFYQYLSALKDSKQMSPLGHVNEGPPVFSCEMATNPDNIKYYWRTIAPEFDSLRQVAQNVTLLMAARKVA